MRYPPPPVSSLPALLLATILVAVPARADVTEELAAQVEKNSWPLQIEADGFSASGWDWLLSRATAARFTLLGESHHNAETPALASALLSALRPAGYEAYVVESGPVTTDRLVGELRDGGLDAATELLTRYPFTLAFLDRREELETVHRALRSGYEVWGVDQEFMGSARLLLSTLEELASDAASRELASSLQSRAQQGFEKFAQSGDQSGAFLLQATAEDFDQLEASFADEGAPALRIVEQLRQSSQIYGHYAAGRYYRNNSERIAWMKHNLLEHIGRDWDSPLGPQRALFKLGAAHAGRGRSPFYQYDLGNLAQELAVISRSESFHVTVLAASSIDENGEVRPWQQPHLQVFFEGVGDQARVFDLGALRPLLTQNRELTEVQQETRDLALRYDALVVLPRFHPSQAAVEGMGP